MDEHQLLGQTLNRDYYLMEIVGAGGMGIVYKAWDYRSKQEVAVKILRPPEDFNHPEYGDFLKRFQREADVISRLHHPNIIQIYDTGEFIVSGYRIPYIVMPYIQGQTLADKIKDYGFFQIHEALYYIKQAVNALVYVHNTGTTHRDIKPGNFLLDYNDTLILTDFGIARIRGSRLTRQGEFIGTKAYAAPEVIYGRNVDIRADIYSLGVVLYEMLTGVVPEDADRSYVTLPAEINAIIQKATTVDVENRYQSVQEFAQAIQDASFHFHNSTTVVNPIDYQSSNTSDPQKISSPVATPSRRFHIKTTFIALLIAIFIAATIVLSLHASKAPSSDVVGTSRPTISTTALIEQARTTVTHYYKYWAEKKYGSAYALLDKTYQHEYSYANLLPYYQHTYGICFSIDTSSLAGSQKVDVYITDNAIEDNPFKSALVTHIYKGYFLATYHVSGWTLMPELKLVSSQGKCLHPMQ